jgi:hypothetical protein
MTYLKREKLLEIIEELEAEKELLEAEVISLRQGKKQNTRLHFNLGTHSRAVAQNKEPNNNKKP